MKKFEVGKSYFVDLGDANLGYVNFRLYKVVKRTAKFVTIEDDKNKVNRYSVKNYHSDFETLEKVCGFNELEACNEYDAENFHYFDDYKKRHDAIFTDDFVEKHKHGFF